MANTDVKLVFNSEGGVYIPATASVRVVSGDTITFFTSDGSPVQLYFSPDALSVLSPTSANPHSIPAGQKASFTFKSSAPGAYSVFFEPQGKSPNSSFPGGMSQQMQFETDFPSITPVLQDNPFIKGK
jgi:plastocyanin